MLLKVTISNVSVHTGDPVFSPFHYDLVRMRALKFAARVRLRLLQFACLALPWEAPRRLRATLAAAPALFVHAFGPYHLGKLYDGISGSLTRMACSYRYYVLCGFLAATQSL